MVAVELDQDEATLVKRARAGDRDAFGSLYTAHLDAIYRYIFFRIGDPYEAEDMTEQVFLKAWEALPGYKDFGHPFTSWLYRIAHNAVVDHHRHNRTVSTGEMDRHMDHFQTAGFLKQAADTDDLISLASAIVCLSDEQQQVIILRFIEGLNHAEVARIMNKSEGACRMIQNRALIALHRLLAEPEGF